MYSPVTKISHLHVLTSASDRQHPCPVQRKSVSRRDDLNMVIIAKVETLLGTITTLRSVKCNTSCNLERYTALWIISLQLRPLYHIHSLNSCKVCAPQLVQMRCGRGILLEQPRSKPRPLTLTQPSYCQKYLPLHKGDFLTLLSQIEIRHSELFSGCFSWKTETCFVTACKILSG